LRVSDIYGYRGYFLSRYPTGKRAGSEQIFFWQVGLRVGTIRIRPDLLSSLVTTQLLSRKKRRILSREKKYGKKIHSKKFFPKFISYKSKSLFHNAFHAFYKFYSINLVLEISLKILFQKF